MLHVKSLDITTFYSKSLRKHFTQIVIAGSQVDSLIAEG